MRPDLRQYLDTLYHTYHSADAAQADRLHRWRSIEPASAALLAVLVVAKQAQNLLEIGTSGGYSTLWLAEAAAQTGGRLTTLEIDPARHATASQHLHACGLAATALCVDAAAFRAAAACWWWTTSSRTPRKCRTSPPWSPPPKTTATASCPSARGCCWW